MMRNRSSRSSNSISLALASAVLLSVTAARAEEAGKVDYDSDPDAERYTLHVQPPALDPSLATPIAYPTFGSVNGINFIDVLLASGFDLSGQDRGNEPSLAANPLNPNQIVLMSFAGSNWASGGNSFLFYSGDGGTTWSFPGTIPQPTGTTTNINCPCDQTPDWGRDGILYATFLHLNTGGSVYSVYSAQSPTPNLGGTWVYRTNAGIAQKTNQAALTTVDQPWLWSGPLQSPQDSQTNVGVVYDNFDGGFINVQTRAADSPAFNPLNFTRDQPTGVDGQQFNDGMNPGNRLAIGPTGTMFALYQRYIADAGSGVKQLTYLINASNDGGQTWGAANSDHATGAKTVAGASVFSFQGNGSKVGSVNALLGGVTAVNVDPATGTAWVVYGKRLTATLKDQLWLVPVTYSSGSLLVGTARQISSNVVNNYLPAVAVLPSGEVGVLFMTHDGVSTFTWRFVQTTDGGATLAKSTTLATFTSPFANNGASNQRILGDYIQLKAVGCEFYGTYPTRGAGVNSVSSIDPYFMRAPAAAACDPGTLTGLSPFAVCAGGPQTALSLLGTGFHNGATALVQGVGRTTVFNSGTSLTTTIQAAEIASPGSLNLQVLNSSPAGGLTGTLQLPIDASPPASPDGTLRVTKGGGNITLNWSATAGARRYNVRRCGNSFPCVPGPVATPGTNTYSEATQFDGHNYWYSVESANGCGVTP